MALSIKWIVKISEPNRTEIKYHFDIFRLVAQFAYVFITLDQIRNAIMVHGDVNLQPLIQT